MMITLHVTVHGTGEGTSRHVEGVAVFCEPAIGDRLDVRHEKLTDLRAIRVTDRVVREAGVEIRCEAFTAEKAEAMRWKGEETPEPPRTQPNLRRRR
jgi:hypothetical protein